MKAGKHVAVSVEELCKSAGVLVDQLRGLDTDAARDVEARMIALLGILRRESKNIRRGMGNRRDRFPDNHVCESLRGQPVPRFADAKRALVRLAKHLDGRIKARQAAGHPTAIEVDELAAIVMLAERIEQADTDVDPEERMSPLEIKT